jgi:hypothetical protein
MATALRWISTSTIIGMKVGPYWADGMPFQTTGVSAPVTPGTPGYVRSMIHLASCWSTSSSPKGKETDIGPGFNAAGGLALITRANSSWRKHHSCRDVLCAHVLRPSSIPISLSRNIIFARAVKH